MKLSTHYPQQRLARFAKAASVATLALLLGFAAAQSSVSPITFRSEIYIVSEVTLDDGSKEERFTAATEAIPGQVVEFRIFAKNSGETTLPAGRVNIYGPIQDGMEFVANSATPSSERILTEYSVDGENFSEPPVLVGAGDSLHVADPSEHTSVRWTLLVPMEPGQEEPFYYRVTIE